MDATQSAIHALARVLTLGIALACSPSLWAQTDPGAYPAKPIRIVVGFAAGGGTDLFARLIAPKMFPGSGQPVMVENKPGAGAIIATEFVAKAPADGYTLLMTPLTTMTVNPAVYPKLPYHPVKDFAPVSLLSSYPYLLVATKAAGVRTMRELIEYAKANPKKANYAGASPVFQLTTVLFKIVTGAPMEYIGYKSSTESVSAVMSGEVLITLSDAPPLTGPLRSGQVVGIGVTSPNRMTTFPEIPTMTELGFPSLEMLSGNGVLAPLGTPPAVVDRLQREFNRIVKGAEVRDRFQAWAADPVGSTPDEFRRLIASELERWTAVAKTGNIKIEQ